MSGYLEIKYPFKANIGLNPFKSWKRQWCILRPSPTSNGGSLAVYCSEAGAPAGTLELPADCVIRRAKSRSRPNAFGVFSVEEPRKPRILLAAPTLHDAQTWMDKIKFLLDNRILGTESLLKDSFSVNVIATELSRKCGLTDSDGTLTLSCNGLLVSRPQKLGTFIEWKHISDVSLVIDGVEKHRICCLTVDSGFRSGGGTLRLWSAQAGEISAAVRRAGGGAGGGASRGVGSGAGAPLSRSEGDLRAAGAEDDIRRSSWYSGPSEVSLDDLDLIMSKDVSVSPNLPRVSGAALVPKHPRLNSVAAFDDSMSDRRSVMSIASGIYEEIPDLPEIPTRDVNGTTTRDVTKPSNATDTARDVIDSGRDVTNLGRNVADTYCIMNQAPQKPIETCTKINEKEKRNGSVSDMYCKMNRECGDVVDGVDPDCAEEPTYERVCECRPRPATRAAPPPLPPRLASGGWSRAGSTCSLPRDYKRQPFSVFRKRLKSDSRIASSPKSETSKENKDVETKKKRFDFTPTRDIFKNFRVSRKMKNLKITPTGTLAKGETKSCEFLDETEHLPNPSRGSKSVECLEASDEFPDFDDDLSIEYNTELTLPQEFIDIILKTRQFNKIRLKEETESEYMTMSAITPVERPQTDHYLVMSPRTNLA